MHSKLNEDPCLTDRGIRGVSFTFWFYVEGLSAQFISAITYGRSRIGQACNDGKRIENFLQQKLKNEMSVITAQLFFDNDLFHRSQLKRFRHCVPPS